MTWTPLEAEFLGEGSQAELLVVLGRNGSGKSRLAQKWQQELGEAVLLSAETEHQFYEQELREDDSNFMEGSDPGTLVGELLGEKLLQHPLLDGLGLRPLLLRGYRSLSTGEARKSFFLASVGNSQGPLLLDDPLAGVDKAAQAELWLAFQFMARQRKLVLFLSQLPSAADFPPAARLARVSHGELTELLAPEQAQLWSQHPPRPLPALLPLPRTSQEKVLVELQDGRIAYGERVVFSGLNFRVERGQHYMICGPNGSGKSSLLQMLTGDHPQAYVNKLSLFGRRRGTGETIWDIKRNVGVFSPALHRDYRASGTALEVLVSGLFDSIGLYQRPEPSQLRLAQEIWEWLALARPSSLGFRELSYGEQRLVLLGRAIIKLPPLLVLDEPTAGLDDTNLRLFHELLASLCSQGETTVLFVSHREEDHVFWKTRVSSRTLQLPVFAPEDGASSSENQSAPGLAPD